MRQWVDHSCTGLYCHLKLWKQSARATGNEDDYFAFARILILSSFNYALSTTGNQSLGLVIGL